MSGILGGDLPTLRLFEALFGLSAADLKVELEKARAANPDRVLGLAEIIDMIDTKVTELSWRDAVSAAAEEAKAWITEPVSEAEGDFSAFG